ncbi:TPA: hypothetical protein KOR75_001126 [Clostridioides difficile]|nr:hypothetical protein [Clostridioides difficile]
MIYSLMNKDNVVAKFVIEETAIDLDYSLGEVYSKLPYGFKDIMKWLEHRQAAKRREHIKELMRQCGCDTVIGYIRVMHCTSINDTFWVKAEDEDVSWKDVSLYDNEFNEVIAKLAFEGAGLFGEQFSSTSPEFGTSGAYSKCCTKGIDNEMFMYKRGTTGFANAGLEPYCEALSSPIYHKIVGDTVEYKLCKLHGKVASKCKIFTNENIGLVPYGYVGTKVGILGALEFYDKFGDADKFRAMLVADAVCFNEDRHDGNHGVLVNNDTLEIIRMAPVYDNNISLLAYAMSPDFNDLDAYLADGHGPRIGNDWVGVARELLTSKTRLELINLQGYKFDFDGDDKFPKARVKVMEQVIERQIRDILGKGKIIGFSDIKSWESNKSDIAKDRAKALLNGGVN